MAKFLVRFVGAEQNLAYNQIQLIKHAQKYTKGVSETSYCTVKICFAERKEYNAEFFQKEQILSIEEAVPLLLKMQEAQFFQTYNKSTRNRYSIKSFVKYCVECL